MVGEIGEILKQEEYKGYTITIERTPEDVVVQLMNNDYEYMPWLYVTNKNRDFGKDVNAMSVPYPIDSDEEAEQAFGDSYILPFYSYTSPHGGECQEVSAGKANGFLVFEKSRFKKTLGLDDPYGYLRDCLTYLDEVLNNERWSVVIYDPDGEIDECYESYWGDEYEKENAMKSAERDVDFKAKRRANKEDEQFDKFWNARGDISDSVRRVKDGSMTDADYSAMFEEIAEEVLEDFSYNVHFKRDVDAYALPASEMKNIIDMCYYPVNLGRVYERIVNGGATTGDKNIDDNVIYLAENLIQDVKDENEGIGDDDVWDTLYDYDHNQVVYIVKAKSVNGGLDIEITVEVGVNGVGNNTVIYNDFMRKNSPDNFMADDSDNERFEGSVRSAIEYARDYIENLEY